MNQTVTKYLIAEPALLSECRPQRCDYPRRPCQRKRLDISYKSALAKGKGDFRFEWEETACYLLMLCYDLLQKKRRGKASHILSTVGFETDLIT